MVTVYVDGIPVTLEAGCTLMDACEAVGVYIPRLCHYPGLGCACCGNETEVACGICLVRMADGGTALACSTPVTAGTRLGTDDSELLNLRRERLAAILARHPHICLSCPDRDGCARDECSHGILADARCCDEIGRCELGKVAAFVDPLVTVPRRAVTAPRTASVEGRIRREPGLCIGCGRCVRACNGSAEAGGALELARPPARPKRGTLRESGCTFCGLCVLVCPTGALTAPGAVGASWLASRCERRNLLMQVLPPEERLLKIPEDIEMVPRSAGLLTLFDGAREVLRVAGVPDLRRGLTEALQEAIGAGASYFRFDLEPMYTQRETELLAQYAREHGKLPLGNDLGDDLFFGDTADLG
jgi:predicted molibdopterin-dependent oxidoreductase YjgC